MKAILHIRQTPGRLNRHPQSGKPISVTGERVRDSTHYQRMLQSGDIEPMDAATAAIAGLPWEDGRTPPVAQDAEVTE